MKNLRIIISLFALLAFSQLAAAQFGKSTSGRSATDRFMRDETESGQDYSSRGWRIGLDLDSGFGIEGDLLYYQSFVANAGYQFNPHFYFGFAAGAGEAEYEYAYAYAYDYACQRYMIEANIRAYLTKKSFTPMLFLNVGYLNVDYDDSLYASIGGGLRYAILPKFGISLQVFAGASYEDLFGGMRIGIDYDLF